MNWAGLMKTRFDEFLPLLHFWDYNFNLQVISQKTMPPVQKLRFKFDCFDAFVVIEAAESHDTPLCFRWTSRIKIFLWAWNFFIQKN